MSNEIAIRTAQGVVEKQDWARAMAPAALLPKAYQGNPANLFLAAEFADALGIERINALTSIHVIEGKPSASADLMAALVRRAGHKLRVSGNDISAKAVIIRADDPEFLYEAEWDMPKARQAGLAGKAVWKNYPAAMLRSRAISEVCRMAASDALLGVIYTPEELGVATDGAGQPTRSTHITTGSRVTAAEIMGRPEPVDLGDVTLEPVEDETEPLITPEQSVHLHALCTDLGLSRDSKLAGLAQITGRVIGSSKELTEADAHEAIRRLEVNVARAKSEDEGGA